MNQAMLDLANQVAASPLASRKLDDPILTARLLEAALEVAVTDDPTERQSVIDRHLKAIAHEHEFL